MNTTSTPKGSDQPDLIDLITLQQAADLSGFSTRHLRHLATLGEIWAKKLGRNWFTTRKAVEEYLSRDIRPGPKQK